MRKPVFGVSHKGSFNLVSSATETILKIEISHVASLHMILSKKRITKVLIILRVCAGWSAPLLFANPRRQVFLCGGPDSLYYNNMDQDQTASMGSVLLGISLIRDHIVCSHKKI